MLKHGGRWHPAHRLAYQEWVENIREGNVVRHFACDNPPCINPEHLQQGSQADNVHDAVAKLRHRARRSLTWDEVTEIRKEYAIGILTQRMLEDVYGLPGDSVSKIVNGKLYSYPYEETSISRENISDER